MTEEQRPARERAYQPWTDQEYGVLEKRYYEQNWSLERIALSLARYPSEVAHTMRWLRNRKEAVEHRQAIKEAFESWEIKQAHEAIRNYPEHLIAEYGSGLRPLDAVHRPKTTILSKADLAEIPEAWKNEYIRYHLIRKARRLVINGKNYDTLLGKARERVHLQIEISATLAGGK